MKRITKITKRFVKEFRKMEISALEMSWSFKMPVEEFNKILSGETLPEQHQVKQILYFLWKRGIHA